MEIIQLLSGSRNLREMIFKQSILTVYTTTNIQFQGKYSLLICARNCHSSSGCCTSQDGLQWESLNSTARGFGHQLSSDGALLLHLPEQSNDSCQIKGQTHFSTDSLSCECQWRVKLLPVMFHLLI